MDPGKPLRVSASALDVMGLEQAPGGGRVSGQGTDRNGGKSGPESGFFDGPAASGT